MSVPQGNNNADAFRTFVHEAMDRNDPGATLPIRFIIQHGRPLSDTEFTFDETDIERGMRFADAIMDFLFIQEDWDYTPMWTTDEGHLAIRTVFAMATCQKLTALLELFTSPNLIDACEVT